MCLDLFLCCSCTGNPLMLPRNYELMTHLGKGGYGFVVKCKKKDTNETVAVKISNDTNALFELQMMKKLKSHNLHQHNIISFLDWFATPSGLALVMEQLDINLLQYIKTFNFDVMPLSDIRSIIKQMAVALDALKNIGIIHGDIKPDNIMMVDHQTQPLKIKLIDFGIAVPTSKTKIGMLLQHHMFRAPEVILGLPFTEAIDMWSLGCVMAMMFTRNPLFRGLTESAIMRAIVYHCGQPPDHLLDKALHTNKYFSRTETNGWTIKKNLPRDNINRYYEDLIEERRFDNKNEAEALEALQCLDLLRAMLRVDPAERITPAEVLAHPFIVEASVTAPDDCTNIGRDHHRQLSKIPLSRRLPVQPAAAEDTLCPEDEESSDSSELCSSMISGSVSWTSSSGSEDPGDHQERQTTNFQPVHRSPSPTIPPSRVIHVRPATAENTLRLKDCENTESLVVHVSKPLRPVTAPEDRETTNIQPARRSPSPTSPPSRVIHVRPATAEDTQRLDDQESLESLVVHVSKPLGPVTAPEDSETTNIQPAHRSPSPTSPPSREIYVRPATAEDTLRLEEEEEESLESLVVHISKPLGPVTAPEDSETTNIQPARRSPSPTSPPSREIYVRPATAEDTLRLEEEEESLESLQAGSKNASESPATITNNDTTSTEDDATVTVTDLTVTLNELPQSPPPATDLSSKKKKNCFQRFFSWMKKTFCSCVTCVDDD